MRVQSINQWHECGDWCLFEIGFSYFDHDDYYWRWIVRIIVCGIGVGFGSKGRLYR